MVTKRIAPLLFTVAASLTAAAVGAGVLGGGMSVSPGVALAGSVRTYATLAALAAAPTSGLTAGAIAATANMGTWVYQPACPAYCDGMATCVTAAGVDGGLGCWGRVPGGVPGATLRSYYSDSNLGNDANDCLAPGAASSPGGHGACKTFNEPWRRVSKQVFDGSLGIYPAFNYTGDYSTENLDLDVYMTNLSFITIACSRSYTGAGIGADGGGYTGYVSGATTWDGGAHQEGIYTVSSTPDAGTLAAFTAAATTADAGFMFEYTSGANIGGSLIIGEPLDAGVFRSPGGVQVSTYGGIEPTAGTAVRLYRDTHAGANAMIRLHGAGDIVITDCDIGPYNNASHSVIVTSDSEQDALIVPLATVVRGMNAEQGANIQPIGSTLTRATVNGYAFCTSSLFAGHVRPQFQGWVDLDDRCMVNGDTTGGLGQAGGGGTVSITGGSMVTNYSSAGGVQIYFPGFFQVGAAFWVWGSPGSSGPAYYIQSGNSSVYTTGFAPAATGTQSGTPLKLAGTSYALSALPLTGFVVLQ